MGPSSASIFTVQRYNIRATHLLLIATYCYLLLLKVLPRTNTDFSAARSDLQSGRQEYQDL